MYQLHASAAKAGVDVLTRNLACEWGPFGVRVVGVAPGIIGDTEGFSRLGGSSAQGQESGSLTQAVPLGRLGCSDDIAAAVVFLCRQVTRMCCGRVALLLTPWLQPRSRLRIGPHARRRRRAVAAPPLGERRRVCGIPAHACRVASAVQAVKTVRQRFLLRSVRRCESDAKMHFDFFKSPLLACACLPAVLLQCIGVRGVLAMVVRRPSRMHSETNFTNKTEIRFKLMYLCISFFRKRKL